MSAWFTSREVAADLGVSLDRLSYLVRKDGLIRVVGRDRVYFPEDVARLRELDGKVRRCPARGKRR